MKTKSTAELLDKLPKGIYNFEFSISIWLLHFASSFVALQNGKMHKEKQQFASNSRLVDGIDHFSYDLFIYAYHVGSEY